VEGLRKWQKKSHKKPAEKKSQQTKHVGATISVVLFGKNSFCQVHLVLLGIHKVWVTHQLKTMGEGGEEKAGGNSKGGGNLKVGGCEGPKTEKKGGAKLKRIEGSSTTLPQIEGGGAKTGGFYLRTGPKIPKRKKEKQNMHPKLGGWLSKESTLGFQWAKDVSKKEFKKTFPG